MTKHLMKSTQVYVMLALNVQVQNENDTQLMTLPLVPLTTLFFALWSMGQSWSRFWFELATLAADIQEAIIFTSKVLTIGLNSMAYGLGVTV